MNLLHTLLHKRLDRFVEKKLLSELGCRGKRFSLSPTPLGVHNYVFYLDIDTTHALVLKGIPKKKRFERIQACSAYLLERGINVPKILWAEEDSRVVKVLPLHIVCEERLRGRTLQEQNVTDEHVVAVARFFSALHGNTRHGWGKIHEEKQKGLSEFLFNKTAERMKTWKKHDPQFSHRAGEELFGWMRTWEPEIDRISIFSLSHCDPNPGNILLTGQDRIFLLDTGHIRYLPRGVDFYTLEVHLCADNQERIGIFEEAYCEGMDQGARSEFNRTKHFFKVFVVVNFAATLAVRLSRSLPGAPFYDECSRYLQTAKQILSQAVKEMPGC